MRFFFLIEKFGLFLWTVDNFYVYLLLLQTFVFRGLWLLWRYTGAYFTLEEHILNAFSLLGLTSGGKLLPWGGDTHMMLLISLTGTVWVKLTWQHAHHPCTGFVWCLVATPGLLEKWSRQGCAKFCIMDFILRFSFQRHKAWGLMLWGVMSLCNVSSVLKLLWVYQSVILSPSVAELGHSFIFCFYNWWYSV